MSEALRREWRRVLASALVAGLLLGGLASAPLAAAGAVVLLIGLRHGVSWTGRVPLLISVSMVCAGAVAEQRRSVLDHSALAPAGQHVVAGVTMESAPRANRAGPGYRALARMRNEPVLLRLREPVRGLRTGSVSRVSGRLSPPDRAARALRANATLAADSVIVTGRRGGFAGFVDGIRERAERSLSTGLPPREAALLSGMVLGQDAALPPDLEDDFRALSLTHLTAASGQNVALLAAIAAFAGIALGAGLRTRWLLTLGLIALYVPLAGGGPSIVRAGIMGAATIAAAWAGRPGSRLDALLAAALITLAIDPRAAGDLGWQLSFAAVAAIGLAARPLAERLARLLVPRVLAEVTAVTCAATVATAPILALRVGSFAPLSIPANLLAAPAVPLVMGMGVISATAGQVAPALAGPPARVAAVPAAYLAELARALAQWSPGVNGPAAPPDDGVLRITALDIGQGDATLLEAGGSRILVDTGPPGPMVLRELRDAGANRLDLLVLTHPQLDHIGAAPALLRTLPVATVLDGRAGDRSPLSRSIGSAAGGTRIVEVAQGQQLTMGPLHLRVLWPPAGDPPPGTDPNDRAIVLLAEAYGRRVLLTADAESNILAPLAPPPVDVLKVSHHGSADSGLPALLDRLHPAAALIEVGERNTYGHPVPATVRALAAAGVRTWRTDEDGTVALDLAADGSIERER